LTPLIATQLGRSLEIQILYPIKKKARLVILFSSILISANKN